MVKAVSRLLMLAGAAVLVLPPGWCCGLVAAECREGTPAARVVPSPVKKACCHHQKSDAGKPAPKPAKPVVPSCCERLPTDVPDSRWPLPDAAVPVAGVVIERAQTSLAA